MRPVDRLRPRHGNAAHQRVIGQSRRVAAERSSHRFHSTSLTVSCGARCASHSSGGPRRMSGDDFQTSRPPDARKARRSTVQPGETLPTRESAATPGRPPGGVSRGRPRQALAPASAPNEQIPELRTLPRRQDRFDTATTMNCCRRPVMLLFCLFTCAELRRRATLTTAVTALAPPSSGPGESPMPPSSGRAAAPPRSPPRREPPDPRFESSFLDLVAHQRRLILQNRSSLGPTLSGGAGSAPSGGSAGLRRRGWRLPAFLCPVSCQQPRPPRSAPSRDRQRLRGPVPPGTANRELSRGSGTVWPLDAASRPIIRDASRTPARSRPSATIPALSTLAHGPPPIEDDAVVG
jgi:hypothetical protein